MKQRGITLIELMVTIAVLAVLATLAAPSFSAFRERQALRGVADNIVATIALAKEEAVKRDSVVRVDFKPFGTDGVCVGAATTTDPDTGCDCASATATTDCTVALFPDVERGLKQVQLTADSIGFGADADGDGTADGSGFAIDPKTATMANLGGSGGLELVTGHGYEVAVQVNALARPTVCTPDGAEKSLPGVSAC